MNNDYKEWKFDNKYLQCFKWKTICIQGSKCQSFGCYSNNASPLFVLVHSVSVTEILHASASLNAGSFVNELLQQEETKKKNTWCSIMWTLARHILQLLSVRLDLKHSCGNLSVATFSETIQLLVLTENLCFHIIFYKARIKLVDTTFHLTEKTRMWGIEILTV